MTYTDKQIDKVSEWLLLAADNCGCTTPEQIEANFETIAICAMGMMEVSYSKIVAAIKTQPSLVDELATKTYLRITK